MAENAGDLDDITLRLQRHMPFLRQMLNNLNAECKQYQKINALCDIIDKAKKVKYATLEKCEKVIILLQSKTKRPQSAPAPAKQPEAMLDTIGSPETVESDLEPGEIRSPSPSSSCSNRSAELGERYHNDRPSIYEAVAETIVKVSAPRPPSRLGGKHLLTEVLPKLDPFEPPISAEDLELLQAETRGEPTPAKTKENTDGVDDVKPVSLNSHKSKVSLVPTPLNKKVPKIASTNSSNKIASKSANKSDKVPSDVKHSNEGKSVAKVHSKAGSSSNHKKIEKIIDGDSIFGNLLSSLDEKLICDKKKVRRDSKEGDHKQAETVSSGSSGSSKHKHSKDGDKKDSASSGDTKKLSGKIKLAEKDLAEALKKEGLSKQEQDDIRHKFQQKIKRYKQAIEALGRHQSKTKDTKGSKEKEKEKEKDALAKQAKIKIHLLGGKDRKLSSDDSKVKTDEKVTEKVVKVVKDPKKTPDPILCLPLTNLSTDLGKDLKNKAIKNKILQPVKSGSSVDSSPIALTTPVEKKIDIVQEIMGHLKQRNDEIERSKTLQPPATPPPCDDLAQADTSFEALSTSPYSLKNIQKNASYLARCATPANLKPMKDDKIVDIRTPADPFSSYIPKSESNDHAGEKQTVTRQDPRLRQFSPPLGGDPRRLRPDAGMQRNPDPLSSDQWNESSQSYPDMYQNNYPARNDEGRNLAPAASIDPFAPQPLRQQARWEPPPQLYNDRWQNNGPQWIRPLRPQVNDHFHPFDPVSNQYDLSRMPPQDFYAPPNPSPNVPNSYKQWRELRQRDEERKRAMALKEQMEFKRMKTKANEETLAMETKKMQLDQLDDEPLECKESNVIETEIETEEDRTDEADKDKADNDKLPDKVEEVSDKVDDKPVQDEIKPDTVGGDVGTLNDPESKKDVTAPLIDADPKIEEEQVADKVETDLDSLGKIGDQSEHHDLSRSALEKIDPDSLLKILSQAKKNADGATYLPTHIVELVENFLQKQGGASPRTPKLLEEQKEVPPIENEETSPVQEASATIQPKEEVSTASSQEKGDAEPIVKRLRRRTKEINYNEREVRMERKGTKQNQQAEIVVDKKPNEDDHSETVKDDLETSPVAAEENTVVEKEESEESIDVKEDVKKDKKKMCSRKSELDKLHENIKETLGDNFLPVARRSSPSIKSSPEAKEVKAAIELEADTPQKAKVLRVVLQKLPNTVSDQVTVPPGRPSTPVTPKRQRLARASKAAVTSYADTGIRSDKENNDKLKKDETVKEDETLKEEETVDIEPPAPVDLLQETINAVAANEPEETKKIKKRSLTPSPIIQNKVTKKIKKEIKTETEAKLKDDLAVDSEKLVEVKEEEPPVAIPPDKGYYLKSDTNACLLCDFAGSQIVAHYMQEHPTYEVLISRLSPVATQDAFEESVMNDYGNIDLSNLSGIRKTAKFDFRCRFCSHDLHNEFTTTFFDHVSSHTGESRFHCTQCTFRHHSKFTVKSHMIRAHNKTQDPKLDAGPINFEMLFGYICSECNYLQLRKEAVEAHIKLHHDANTTYVYTINMSLPILARQRQRGRKRKAPVEETSQNLVAAEEVPADGTVSPALSGPAQNDMTLSSEIESKLTRLRSSHRLQKHKQVDPVKPEGNMKTLMQKLAEKDNFSESVVDFDLPQELLEHKKTNTDADPDADKPNSKTNPADSNSAFVCQDWDELLKMAHEDAPVVVTPEPKRSGFLDQLKKRFDDDALIEEMSTFDMRLTHLPPIDKEVSCTSAMDNDYPITPPSKKMRDKSQSPVAATQAVTLAKEVIPGKMTSIMSTVSRLQDTLSKDNDSLNLSTVSTPTPAATSPVKAQPKLLSVSIVDALIDKDNTVSYLCRKPSCIFQTKARRVLEAHCTYTHPKLLEQLVCNVCQCKSKEMTMIDIFAHLCHHVDNYFKENTVIKQEVMDEDENVTNVEDSPPMDDVASEPKDNNAEEISGPPKFSFKIVKVESLAENVNNTPPPAEVLSPTFAITCKIVPMSSEEIKRDRKHPSVMRKWIVKGLKSLFKCPEFTCSFVTSTESAFDEHLAVHQFKDTFVPCLYCNFKMREEFIKIHLMMRHARCKFGCGYCLYRAVKKCYVQIHNDVIHATKELNIINMEYPVMPNRFRPPSLPSIKCFMKLYECGCKKTYVCTKNFAQHLMNQCHVPSLQCAHCNKTFTAVSKLVAHHSAHNIFEFCCRYCEFGAETTKDVLYHIALQHPFHEIAILTRQQSDFNVSDTEHPDICNKLEVLNENTLRSSLLSPSSNALALPTLAPLSNIDGENQGHQGVQRIMLLHPIYVQNQMVVTPTISTTSTSTTNVITTPALTPTFTVSSAVSLSASVSAPTTKLPEDVLDVFDVAGEDDADDALRASDKLFQCNQCLAILDSSPNFQLHLVTCKDESNINRPHVCFHCKRNYKHCKDLIDHIRVHGIKNLSCGLCGHKEPHQALLRKHIKNVHKLNNIHIQPMNPTKTNPDTDEFIAKPGSAQLPKTTATTANGRNPEVRTKMAGNEEQSVFDPTEIGSLPMMPIFRFVARCKMCDYASKVRSNFVRHMSLHATGKIDLRAPVTEAINPVPCLEKNELMFDKMTNLAASSHEGGRMQGGRMSTGSVVTVEGPAGVGNPDLKVPDSIPDNRRYVCGATGCNYLCLEEQNLRHHLQALHDREQNYTCIHCKEDLNPTENYIDIDAIVSHLRLHESTLYKCGYCEYLNNVRTKLERHCTDKHSDKPLKVIAVRQEVDLEDLTEMVAKKKRLWRCGVCASRKATEEEIKTHVQDKHTLNAQFKCTYCQFRSDIKESFGEHFESKHSSLSPDIIVAYYKEEFKEKEKEDKTQAAPEETAYRFDTTPLWVKNRVNNVKHIRGILLDEEENTSKTKAKDENTFKTKTKDENTSKTKAKQTPAKTPPARTVSSTAKRRISIKGAETSTPVKQIKPDDGNIVNVTPSAIIEIDDDVIVDVEAPAFEDESDPSVLTLSLMPIAKLLGSNYTSTYGPLGTPNDTMFACPLCNANDFADYETFRQHLFEELQYHRYECELCHWQTTTVQKLKAHYSAQHVIMCDSDSVKELQEIPSIELWIRKVYTLQHRIIEYNSLRKKKVPKPKTTILTSMKVTSFRCGHCNHKVPTHTGLIAHSTAAHPTKELKIIRCVGSSR